MKTYYNSQHEESLRQAQTWFSREHACTDLKKHLCALRVNYYRLRADGYDAVSEAVRSTRDAIAVAAHYFEKNRVHVDN